MNTQNKEQSSDNATDPRNFAIGVLSTTACVLFVGLVLLQAMPRQSEAAGVTESSGNYTITVGVASIDDEEIVYVINNREQKMIAYRFDANRKTIVLATGVDLKPMLDAAAASTGQSPPKGKHNRGRGRRRHP